MITAITPMLAKPVPELPAPDSVPGGLAYEPKWDGFRALVSRDGGVEIGSRGARPLTRYFPELVDAFSRLLPTPCLLDGEVVVRTGSPGRERLDWDALTQRIHPAASRVERLARETPASFVAFDLLEVDGQSLLTLPFADRRERLQVLLADTPAPIHLTRMTTDVVLARRWLVEFEGAGLDGVIAKPLAAPYTPGKRTMLKVKHERTADVVVLGYRVHTSGRGVGSLLLGLYDAAGQLRNVGGASAFSDRRRVDLLGELEPFVMRDDDGPIRRETERSRFASGKDVSYVALVPALVAEVRYDHMEGDRFRHVAQFVRWRPDREPRSCTFDQLEVPAAYDLGDVLVVRPPR